jgi:hypothetical protein
MKIFPLAIFAVCLLLGPSALSQEIRQAGQSGTDQANTPSTLSGQPTSNTLLSETVAPNSMDAGITIATMYTDNARLTETGAISNTSFRFEPNIAFHRNTARTVLSLNAWGGLLVNQELPEQNQAAENATLGVTYRFTPYKSIRISENFLNSNGLFADGLSSPSVGAIQGANPSVFTYAQFMSNTALAEFNWQFTEDSIVGARGTYYRSWYPDSSPQTTFGQLFGNDSISVESFYNYRFSARQWAGLLARAQRFKTEDSGAKADTLTALLLYAFNITPHMTLSLFGGPEYSDVTGRQFEGELITTLRLHDLQPAGGATFDWQAQRRSATISFVHQISDGAGLGSTVTLSSVDGVFRQMLGAGQMIEGGLTYSQNNPTVSGQPNFNSYSIRAIFTRQLGRSCSIWFGYGRDEFSEVTRSGATSANRVSVSFIYRFTRPLGGS